jgi:hypothetical protein
MMTAAAAAPASRRQPREKAQARIATALVRKEESVDILSLYWEQGHGGTGHESVYNQRTP